MKTFIAILALISTEALAAPKAVVICEGRDSLKREFLVRVDFDEARKLLKGQLYRYAMGRGVGDEELRSVGTPVELRKEVFVDETTRVYHLIDRDSDIDLTDSRLHLSYLATRATQGIRAYIKIVNPEGEMVVLDHAFCEVRDTRFSK